MNAKQFIRDFFSAAINFFLRLSTDADTIPCDNDLTDFELTLPSWFDGAKYKR